MNLQIDYLRTFIALAEAKNFTKTGIQVNLSQSAVSMQIKRLETEVGKKLFDRIVYVTRSISRLLDAVTSGFAIAPIIKSNVPLDLKIAGIEDGLPILPVSNIALHKTRKVSSKIIDCFSEYVIKSFREKTEI